MKLISLSNYFKMQHIDFKVIYPEAKSGEYGSAEDPSPYFGLSAERMTRSVGGLQDKFDVVIDKPRIRVVFSYPLEKEHIIELTPLFGAKNFTRVGLGKAVSVQYQRIYEEEEKTSSLREETYSNRYENCALMNRAPTDGKWGIWGHVLDDLDLREVEYDEEKDLYYLIIDS